MTATRMRQRFGAWLLFPGTIVGLGASRFGNFWAGNGIHGTDGVLLVSITSVVMWVSTGLVHIICILWLAGRRLTEPRRAGRAAATKE